MIGALRRKIEKEIEKQCSEVLQKVYLDTAYELMRRGMKIPEVIDILGKISLRHTSDYTRSDKVFSVPRHKDGKVYVDAYSVPASNGWHLWYTIIPCRRKIIDIVLRAYWLKKVWDLVSDVETGKLSMEEAEKELYKIHPAYRDYFYKLFKG